MILSLNLFLIIGRLSIKISNHYDFFVSIMKYYLSGLTTSKSFLGPVLILEVPLAAETKKKKPTIPDIPKIAARGSKEKENIKIYKIRVNNSF